ncbi:MAG TPA: hypothetical protein VK886_10550 [Vicinamibacterales bacterium]|nr:hypothetical protein [Vicinamibacterales bacterium]
MPRWAWAIIIVIALAVIGIVAMAGAGIYFVTRQVQVREATPANAASLFEEHRVPFKDATPLIELDSDGDIRRSRLAEAVERRRDPAPPVEALHVLAWDANDEKVVEVAIPFWLLRLKRGPIDVFSDTAGLRRADIRITVDDLEALGPSLLVDHRDRNGDRVLVWTQ